MQREIVLDPGFVSMVNSLNPARKIPDRVESLAKALAQLPVELAEDVIYHSLTTYSLGGSQLDQEELELSLLELMRLRAESGDGFPAEPLEKWGFLLHSAEYQEVQEVIGDSTMEMGMVLHTISRYLKNHEAQRIDKTIESLERFRAMNKRILEVSDLATIIANARIIRKNFGHQIIGFCSDYVGRS